MFACFVIIVEACFSAVQREDSDGEVGRRRRTYTTMVIIIIVVCHAFVGDSVKTVDVLHTIDRRVSFVGDSVKPADRRRKGGASFAGGSFSRVR